MEAVSVKVAIEPSSSNGEALWVRSPEALLWKWYGSRIDACVEAAQLGLAARELLASGERFSLVVRYSAKENPVADFDELARFGFEPPPANMKIPI
jgi:hypothetical protein